MMFRRFVHHSPNSFAVGVLAVLRATRATAPWSGWNARNKTQKSIVLLAFFRLERRISREITWVAWLGRVFREKKAGLDGLGAYFLRKINAKYVQIQFFDKLHPGGEGP